jgi:hypothetical protein
MRRSPRLWLLGGVALVLVAGIVVLAVLGVGGGEGGGGTATSTRASTTTGTTTTGTTTTGTSTSGPTATSTRTPSPQPPSAPQQLGASVNILFNSVGTFAPAQIDAQLQALQATGATIARSDTLWERVEPAPPVDGVHHYLWGFDDSIAGALAAHRIEWLPIVDYSAPWTRPPAAGGHPPPSSVADYAAYAGAFAARYGPGGSFWRAHPELPPTPVHSYEIWNEPDNRAFWSPRPDAAAYAELYSQARAAIIAVDPGARVIVGGLTHPEAFMPALIAASPGLRGEIDGVAIHPYAGSPAAVLVRVRQARDALRGLGLGDVPLYVTEFGWTTRPPHALNWAPPEQRASDISRAFAALGHTDCKIAAVVLYTWVTLEQNPANREDWYGISPPGGGPTADTAAFAAGLHDASAPGPRRRACSAPG